ncbi:putative manganese efflux pump MntP [Paenibacillus montaniterrae]|uniref:Putative manganese efflux pump MntP n=2 Tax=Paenibacillus montaniterrae TaxID=429341 RepID=A0A919YV44_9BACL|nr:putative manganese efflux pump MntP [Paenibacillus montaniterrae]
MMEMNIWLGQLTTITMIALALGFDAFSLGVGIGLKGIRYLHIMKLGIIIGLFHMIMPIGGMLMGKMMSVVLGEWASFAAGLLLIILGVHMVINSFKSEEAVLLNHRTFWGVLLLAFSVSVDSFSVGITLGMFHLPLWVTVLLFGCCGAIMAMLGLTVGKRVGHTLGEYGETLGGIILVVFGVYFIV